MPKSANPRSNQFAAQKLSGMTKKKNTIKHSMLIADYGEGGYKDIDIMTKISALKVAWIMRLMDDNFHHVKVIPTLLLLNAGR